MTQQEFDEKHQGDMVSLICTNHPNLSWFCKKLSVTKDASGKYRWNGSRKLFYNYHTGQEECNCSVGY